MRPESPRTLLRSAKVPAFLVTDLSNIHYLSGLALTAGFLLVEEKKMSLFVDGRYLEAAKKGARKGIHVRSMDAMEKFLKRRRVCGVESNEITLQRFARLKRKFKNTKFVQTVGVIESFRRAKDVEELRLFRRAQSITRKMLARIPGAIRHPISERGLALKLLTWAIELGADDLSFPAIVAFGTNTSRPHHQPTSRVLRRGDLVQIDVGARFHGYCADQSAIFFTSPASARVRRVHQAVKESKHAAERAVRAGASTVELDRIAREVLKSYGLEKYFVHALGHGVGLEIHEGPTLSSKAPDTKLLKGEIVTIEPGVYIPGRFGIRLEDEVIVR